VWGVIPQWNTRGSAATTLWILHDIWNHGLLFLKERNIMATFLYMAGTPLENVTRFLPFILIFVVFYMFMIRPGQKRQKTWQSMLAALKSGDRVTTTGGIRGTVIFVKEDVVVVSVKPDNIKLELAKSAIASVTTPEDEAKS